MAHPEQRNFCEKVLNKFPEYFRNKRVLDVGSLDVNGNNRFLFTDCEHIGIDVGAGPNVDVVCKTHELDLGTYDVIISTECFEHDIFYPESFKNIVRILRPGGLFLFTCAATGRPEHGTARISPEAAPLLTGDWADYYKNLTEQDIREVLDVDVIFSSYEFEICESSHDLYFWGFRKNR